MPVAAVETLASKQSRKLTIDNISRSVKAADLGRLIIGSKPMGILLGIKPYAKPDQERPCQSFLTLFTSYKKNPTGSLAW